jgi:glycosyltransferase involved in cell wall biosynthesis
LRQAPITFVGISPWVSQQLRTSPITAGRPVEMIWNCIDEQCFQPLAKAEARRALGLDVEQGPVVLAELRSPASEPWKGFQHLLAILPDLRSRGIRLWLFGAVPPDLEGLLPSDVRLFGRIDDDAQLRRLYAAADVFVCPTLEEAFGKTMAEAMACGTPVLAFRCSAPADLVEPGLTGLLVEPHNADALLGAIVQLLPQAERLSDRCAQRARTRFSKNVSASAYSELYGRLLTGFIPGFQPA